MEVHSAPSQGCTVFLEVPVPRRAVTMPMGDDMGSRRPDPTDTDDPAHLAMDADDLHIDRKVHLYGSSRQADLVPQHYQYWENA